MAGKRNELPEEEQKFLAKFCQLNRGPQGIMFNNMCVKMRGHLKEEYPSLEKWEDLDYENEEKKSNYLKVVDFLLDDYIKEKREQPPLPPPSPSKDGEKGAEETSA